MTDLSNLKPPTVKVDLKMEVGLHPKDCVLAVEEFTKHLCKATRKDPGEATMMLLTAAVHVALAYSKDPAQIVLGRLGTALGSAVAVALDWWPVKDLKERKTILHS